MPNVLESSSISTAHLEIQVGTQLLGPSKVLEMGGWCVVKQLGG